MSTTHRGKPHSVLILGAGVAGLACAYELASAGINVTVVEQDDHVGGLASTIEKNGFRFDTGPHRWYAKNDEINRWLLDFMKDELIKVPRLTRIYFDRKFFHYPIRISGITALPLWQTILAVWDYTFILVSQLIAKKEPKTLESGYINKFGFTLYKIFFKRYSEKLWGRSCTVISSDWIDQRTRGFNALTVIKEMFMKSNTVSFVDEFYYPKLGIGRIAQKLAETVKQKGGKIILNAKVKNIYRTNNRIKSVKVQIGKNMKQFTADEFVSTIPLPYLISIIDAKVPTEILYAAKKLQFRSEVQVVLLLKKSKITKDSWIYVHPFELCFVRMMEMDNWSDKMQPNKKSTAYVLEVPCEFNDQTWKMSDKDIVEKVTNDFINEFGFVKKKDIIGSYVHRIENLLPVYHLGYQKPLTKIKAYLKGLSNLQIAGRNGIFRYNNTDHSIEMGFYAARNIIFGDKNAFDIESVNASSEYLEEKKINYVGGENFEDRLLNENKK